MSDAAIIAENLSKSFGSIIAVDGLNLRVGTGEIFGLVGPDGAGKTTTIRLLCGVLRADAGRIVLAGREISSGTASGIKQIGYLPQRFSLYGDLTVMENLRFFADVQGLRKSEWQTRTREILDFVGLGEFVDRRADQLSGGMKQKLALAVALVHRPQILLLDEPTGGVDPITRQDFWQLIIRLVREEGVSVLISTPYMDEASRCTRVGFIHRGRIIVEGRPSEVTARVAGRVLELAASPRERARQVAQSDADVEDVQVFGDRLHLRVAPGSAERVLARLPDVLRAQEVQVDRMRVIAPGLEDAIIELLSMEGDML